MLREAGDFANHLKRCEKDIRSLKNATEGKLAPCAIAAQLLINPTALLCLNGTFVAKHC